MMGIGVNDGDVINIKHAQIFHCCAIDPLDDTDERLERVSVGSLEVVFRISPCCFCCCFVPPNIFCYH